ncbi:ATP-binding protein [Corallococcus sp. CA054B]|uniref:sensor histidine kinase n=1 Tax=Corallococcus sp. CA054B TaxID=2316734 RepID=UPI001F22B5F3|nr:ATP-binding protein [Corallococcus sp. CA054B]
MPPCSPSPRAPESFHKEEGSALLRYGLAVVSVVVAFAVQRVLWPITASTPYLAFFAAVVFSSWRGGWGPGLVSTGLSLLMVQYFFLHPLGEWRLEPENIVALLFFLALSLFATTLNVRLRRANAERADLLERERAARAAAEYERARLHELFMHAPAHLVIFRGPQHVFELSNPLNSVMLGNPPQLLGLPAREVGPKEEAERVARILDHVYATGEPFEGREVSLKLPQPDGTLREYIFDVTYTPTHDTHGQVDGIAGFGFDVTDVVRARSRAERLARELSHNEEHLRLLAGASSFLATSLDDKATLRNVVRLAVPTLADWCVIDSAKEDGTFQRMEVEHATTEPESLAESLRSRSAYVMRIPGLAGPGSPQHGQPLLVEDFTDDLLPHFTDDLERLALLKELRVRSLVVVPLVTGERSLGLLSFITTHRSGRRYTKADLPFLQELANRAALSMENARLYREAREAVRLRDEFLSIASHELKTPLTPLNLKLQALRRELDRHPGPVPREVVERYLDVGSRQLKKLAELVNDLLDVSRIAAGRLSMECVPMDLAELVRDVVAAYEGPAARSGSVLQLECMDSVTMGVWDRPRLEQVVVNLVDNAIKYGQGRPIQIRLETRDGKAALTVRDQGIGISEESLPRLFGRFERAVSDRHYGGLGLGLYITRTLVEAMGGTVRVESRLGQGSVFTVELPLTAAPAGVGAPAP